MRFAVGDSGSFLDAVKGGLVGAAFDNGLGGGALGAAGFYDPMKGVLGTDSGPANFIKEGGVAGLAGYEPMKGIVGGLFDKGGESSGFGGINPFGFLGNFLGQ